MTILLTLSYLAFAVGLTCLAVLAWDIPTFLHCLRRQSRDGVSMRDGAGF
jgi:hypothetical protein